MAISDLTCVYWISELPCEPSPVDFGCEGVVLKYLYNFLKIDKTNHRRERDKGHITRTRRMWQSNRRPSLWEREE